MGAQGETWEAPARLVLGAMCFRDRPFPAVLDAAAASGFDGVGLSVGQCLSAVERGTAVEAIPDLLADRGLRLAELELVRLCDDGPARLAGPLVEELALALAPQRLHVAAFSGDDARIHDEYAALCARLPGVLVALEPMPYSRVRTTAAGLSLVEAVGAPNARLVLDVLHFSRSGGRLADITPSLMERVVGVQLADAVERPGVALVREARHLRTHPGRGTLDVVGFLRAVAGAVDVLPPVDLEPMSDALEQLPLAVVAEDAMLSALRVLGAAGWALRDGRYVPAG